MNEADFIAALRTLPLHAGARELEDDCAVLEIGSETLIITHDAMAEGTHFLPDADPADVAWKLVAVNLSDLSAKGAEPVGILLGHMLGNWDECFLEGLRQVTELHDVPLLGGDTIRSEGPRVLGLTAIGRAAHTPVPSRSGAQAGDGIYVTGELGHAMLGFEALRDGTEADSSAYRRPTPLLEAGKVLAPHVTAMMDISDGLLLDCWRMAKASDAAIELESTAIPVAVRSRLEECIRWGDDYQLLFTADFKADLPVEAARIGQVTASQGGALVLDGAPLSPEDDLGYQH
ncbi:thiamine-phosphate kinase [Altererythrobacter sp. MF3-039]|uniref:thiamine-phosphate kinase n=1 Tax=Altererythrobacter sp. MF3-039 TaxID=3252901 RepID=UPI00390C49C0